MTYLSLPNWSVWDTQEPNLVSWLGARKSLIDPGSGSATHPPELI